MGDEFDRDDLPDEYAADEDLSYEPFDDVAWTDLPADAELEVIDLEALDDEIEPVERDAATENLLETLKTLDDAIVPAAEAVEPEADTEAETAPEEAESVEAETVEAAADVEPDEVEADEVAEPEPELPAPEAAVEVEEPPAEPVPVEAEPVTLPDRDAVETPPAAATVEAVDGEADETSEPSPPDLLYRVVLELPPDLAAEVELLRGTGAIADAPPGIVLLADFRAEDGQAVEALLRDWADGYLPLDLEIVEVQAEVIGAHQYVAAWALEPARTLHVAQGALVDVLADAVTPAGEAAPFLPQIVIGDRIAARRYPHLIAQMQRDFEPLEWRAESLVLQRVEAESEAQVWETTARFGAAVY